MPQLAVGVMSDGIEEAATTMDEPGVIEPHYNAAFGVALTVTRS